MHAVKFLLTSQCNLRCDFCHNEFQGDATRAQSGTYPFIDTKVREILAHHPRADTIKLSGGEPLLLPKQAVRILELSNEFSGIKQRILLSNLAINAPTSLQAVIQSGITEVRVNVPHLTQKEYSLSVGRDRLNIVLANCHQAAGHCKIRLQKVIQPETDGLEHILDYLRAASNLEFVSTVALLVDARSARPKDSFEKFAEKLGYCYQLIETGDRHRYYQSSKLDIVLSRCSLWDGISDAEEETDIYVVPPGNRLISYVSGKAY
jgi:molybdenum cofactor biosynthesis enzyme MoaA